ncbi:MAG: THUMP-like domain-containing protein [Planctomycetales bacterium]
MAAFEIHPNVADCASRVRRLFSDAASKKIDCMLPPPGDSPFREPWDRLLALRETPQILSRIDEATLAGLELQTQLRREFEGSLVRDALALCELRRQARGKFTRAAQMWFDRVGLEQATSEPVARHKAQRFRGRQLIADLCCGIGGDTLALAQESPVVAWDQNPVACQRAAWNAAIYDIADRATFRSAGVEEFDPSGWCVHLDPDRRARGGARAVRIEDYVPDLEFMRKLMESSRGGAIKLSPACNFGGKFPDAEVELVSWQGECKEATIWFGELRESADWRATVLPSGESLAGNPLDYESCLAEPAQFVFDPDPAVVRAGMVDAAAQQLGLHRLDLQEEYLTGPEPTASPFVQAFELLANLPNNATEIRRYFRTSEAGQVEIKCRHVPIDAATVRRKLPLPGHQPYVLIFARIAGRTRALVCRRVTCPSASAAAIGRHL